MKKTPPHYVIYRSVVAGLTTLILVVFGFGLAGAGPMAGIGQITTWAVAWFQSAIGVVIQ